MLQHACATGSTPLRATLPHKACRVAILVRSSPCMPQQPPHHQTMAAIPGPSYSADQCTSCFTSATQHGPCSDMSTSVTCQTVECNGSSRQQVPCHHPALPSLCCPLKGQPGRPQPHQATAWCHTCTQACAGRHPSHTRPSHASLQLLAHKPVPHWHAAATYYSPHVRHMGSLHGTPQQPPSCRAQGPEARHEPPAPPAPAPTSNII